MLFKKICAVAFLNQLVVWIKTVIVDGIQCQFMISKEDLASGSGTSLAHSELLCGRSFITGKKVREMFWHREKCSGIDTRRGQKLSPSLVLSKPYILYQINSHNIHLRLTKLELM